MIRWASALAVLVTVTLTITLTGSAPDAYAEMTAQRLRVEVLATHPHDPSAFTQGLELRDGVLYEGTGQYARSELREVDPTTGEVRRRVRLPEDTFGEGITVVGPWIWQLTYREHVAFLRDRATLAEIRRVPYEGEGWGLCHDRAAGRLVMSDGSDRLTFRDPRTFQPLGSVAVTVDGRPLRSLNELECVGGWVWANVWLTDEIVRIDPRTGRVAAVVDASGLLTPEERADANVLNGIAALPGRDRFIVTGKYWPTAFTVRFVPA
jgi:glutaminyl-peptide cyclotransferase